MSQKPELCPRKFGILSRFPELNHLNLYSFKFNTFTKSDLNSHHLETKWVLLYPILFLPN